MSERTTQKHPEGCTHLLLNLTADPRGEHEDTNVTAMTHHEGAPLEEASYICSQCGNNLNSYSKLMKHQETHKNAQPIKCPECGIRFNNMTGLSLHQKIHTIKTLYTCTDCDKSFIYNSHLMEHQKNHVCADKGSVNEALMYKSQDMNTIQWSLEEKREIMYCYYYASSLQPEGYIQLLRSKLEQRGIFPLAKLRCASDSKLRCVIYQVKCRQYISDDNLEILKSAAKDEIEGEI